MPSYIRGDDNFDSATSVPTTASVLSATAGASAGAVGSYVFGGPNTGVAYSYGSTVAGASLLPAAIRFSGAAGDGSYASQYWGTNNGTLSGTWRKMGGQYAGTNYDMTLWLRIA
jgi:hypothetical protein